MRYQGPRTLLFGKNVFRPRNRIYVRPLRLGMSTWCSKAVTTVSSRMNILAVAMKVLTNLRITSFRPPRKEDGIRDLDPKGRQVINYKEGPKSP